MLRHTAVAGFWTHDGERVRGAALHKDDAGRRTADDLGSRTVTGSSRMCRA